MKKVVLSLAVLFSVALVACSNKENKAADTDTLAADTMVVAEDTTAVVDSAVADSAAADTAVKVETPAK